MTTQDRISISGFVSIGALVVAPGRTMFVQLDWLRSDVNSRIDGVEERLNIRIDGVETRMSGPEEAMREPGERMARFEGALSATAAPVGLNETPDSSEGDAGRRIVFPASAVMRTAGASSTLAAEGRRSVIGFPT